MAYPYGSPQPFAYPNPYEPASACPPGYPPQGPPVTGSYPPAPGGYPVWPAAGPAPPAGYPGGYPAYPGPGCPPAPGFYPPPPYASQSYPAAKSYYYIRSRLNGHVLDIEGGSRNPGARVIMWSQKSSDCDNQLWYDDFQTGTIRSKLNDFCLDVEGDTLVVKPYNPHNVSQQLERAEPFVRSRLSQNKVLDIAGGTSSAGARVILHDKHGGVNQCFDTQFIQAQPAQQTHAPRPKFFIVSEMNGKVFDIKGDNAGSGASVIMWPKKGGKCPNQLWYFDEQGVIRSALNDFALESRSNDVAVTMMPFNGNPDQRWSLVGNRIMKNQQHCLDIRGANRADGAAVICYDYKGSANQHWRIEYV